MIRQVIKYTDLNDVEQEEVAYFHISKTDLVKLNLQHEDLGADIRKMTGLQMYEMMAGIIRNAYGVRSADGGSFKKSAAATQAFEDCGALDAMLFQFLENPASFEPFLKGCLPSGVASALDKKEN